MDEREGGHGLGGSSRQGGESGMREEIWGERAEIKGHLRGIMET
jgi:hypothetical protein